jgi:hypothetical protein
MAIVRDFQVNNGLEVAVNANVVGNTTSLDYIANTTGSTIAPSITFNFTRATKTLDPRLTFARPSNATYRDVNGFVAYSLDNTPRFNYNSNGVCQGILIEKGSTNDAPYSTNIGNTAHYTFQEGVSGALGMTLNAGTAPDGSNTATYLYHATTSGTFKSVYGGLTIINNRIYTHSVWVKSNNQPTFSISHYDGGDSMNTINFLYTFASNTFATSTNGSANCAIIGGPNIEPYKDGWYRVSYSYHYTAGTTPRYVQLKYNLDTTSTAVGTGVFYWGAQHEWNDKPSTFIPTTVGSATRAYEYLYCADDARGNNLTSWFNNNQGTVHCEWNVPLTGPTNSTAGTYSGYPGPYVFWKSEGDGGNVVTHFFYADASASKSIGVEQFQNGTFAFSQGGGAASIANNVTYKVTVGYSNTNHSWSFNGSVANGGTPLFSTPPITNRLDLGRSRANWLDGHIKTFKYWPTKLANTDIQYSTLV